MYARLSAGIQYLLRVNNLLTLQRRESVLKYEHIVDKNSDHNFYTRTGVIEQFILHVITIVSDENLNLRGYGTNNDVC